MGRSSRIEFCCCAIPLINVGSYTICAQFAIVAFCTLILSVAPPSIVAATGSLPAGWPKFIVLVLALAVLLWQIVGVVAIRRERTGLYRSYIRINFLLTLVTIVVTTAFFAVAAARHSVALDSCDAAYGSSPDGNTITELNDVGRTICNIFIWVQVGAMGILLLVIGLMQLYMCVLQRAYGKEMRRAAQEFKSYSGPGDEIPLATRESAVWEPQSVPATRGAGGLGQGGGASSDDSEHARIGGGGIGGRGADDSYAAYRYGDETRAGQAYYYGDATRGGGDQAYYGGDESRDEHQAYYGRRGSTRPQGYETYGQPQGGYYSHHKNQQSASYYAQ